MESGSLGVFNLCTDRPDFGIYCITQPHIRVMPNLRMSGAYLLRSCTSLLTGPEIGTSSIDWPKLGRFYLQTETESSLRNVVF
jgi:hypothetical protein